MGLLDWLLGGKPKEGWELTTKSKSKYTIDREGENWFIFIPEERTPKIIKYLVISFDTTSAKTVSDLQEVIGKEVIFNNPKVKSKWGHTSAIMKVRKL